MSKIGLSISFHRLLIIYILSLHFLLNRPNEELKVNKLLFIFFYHNLIINNGLEKFKVIEPHRIKALVDNF